MKPALVILLLLGLRLEAQIPNNPEPAEESEAASPTLPSRGGPASVTKEGELMRIRPYVSLQGIWDSGLTAVTVDQSGNPTQGSDYGVEGTLGVLGFHSWKRTVLGLDYRGTGRHYAKNSYYDGFDNSLMLSLDHQFSRRWQLMMSQSVTSFSKNYFSPYASSWLGVSDYAPSEVSDLAGHELFDSRATALSSTVRAVYQSTPRLSFSFGGSGMVVRRRSAALPGTQGFSAAGDTAYRISRNQTIGVDYSFNHFDFQNAFGSADAHGIAFNYSSRIGRAWELRLRAGGHRVETQRLNQVALDPVIASIIGRNYGIETYHSITYMPRGEFRLIRTINKTLVAVSVSRDISPGNGVLLTSASETGGIEVSWTATKRLSAGCSFDVSRMKSIGENIGHYMDYGGGGGLTISLGKGLSIVTRADVRHYELRGTALVRDNYRTSVGLAWSPGDTPLTLW